MLCDDLVADDALAMLYDGMDEVCDKIRRAQKFVLAREFAIAADGLVENHTELHKIAEWCRVPYPLVWFEWLHADRPHWDDKGPFKARPVDPSRHQFSPHRIGMLMEQDGRASRWKTHLFWDMRAGSPTVPTPRNGSLCSHWFDTEKCAGAPDPLVAAVQPEVADFGGQMLARLALIDRDAVKTLGQYAIEDWGGEIRFMVAMLGLLNTRNVAETSKVDNTAMNFKRKRHGKRELFSHHVLKVRPSIYSGETGTPTGRHRDLRLHFVRGHIKRRASGIYWWNAHARGHIQSGAVFKNYEVT